MTNHKKGMCVRACMRACMCHMQCPQLSHLKDLLLYEEFSLLLIEKNSVIKTGKRKTKGEMYLEAGNMISKFLFDDFFKDETHLFTHA